MNWSRRAKSAGVGLRLEQLGERIVPDAAPTSPPSNLPTAVIFAPVGVTSTFHADDLGQVLGANYSGQAGDLISVVGTAPNSTQLLVQVGQQTPVVVDPAVSPVSLVTFAEPPPPQFPGGNNPPASPSYPIPPVVWGPNGGISVIGHISGVGNGNPGNPLPLRQPSGIRTRRL